MKKIELLRWAQRTIGRFIPADPDLVNNEINEARECVTEIQQLLDQEEDLRSRFCEIRIEDGQQLLYMPDGQRVPAVISTTVSDRCREQPTATVLLYVTFNGRQDPPAPELETLMEQAIEDHGMSLVLTNNAHGRHMIGVARDLELTGITQDEARFLLATDLQRVIDELEGSLSFFRSLPEFAGVVLIRLALALGVDALEKYQAFLELVKAQAWREAADELDGYQWTSTAHIKLAERLVKTLKAGK